MPWNMVGVRGFPNGIVIPWARWTAGLALAKILSSVAAAIVVPKFGNIEHEIWMKYGRGGAPGLLLIGIGIDLALSK